jgi:head-tail adaptor
MFDQREVLMALPSGILREVVVIEAAQQVRNELGESVQANWREFTRRRASVEDVGYTEAQVNRQTGGSVSHVVRMRFVPGLVGGMRLRWESRGNRLLYVSSVVERGHREEHEVYAEERA